jgi:sugar fermentation stimulation protein A
VQISLSSNPGRKLPWTLERVDMGAGWVGVNTARPNAVVAEAIAAGRVSGLTGYRELRREAPYAAAGHRGRLDIRLSDGAQRDALVEVKNVTLPGGDLIRFPDAVSERGLKHLNLLLGAVEDGYRGVILFAVNRPEGRGFAPAWEIDPAYGRRLREVAAAGVEVVAVRIRHTAEGMEVEGRLPVELD